MIKKHFFVYAIMLLSIGTFAQNTKEDKFFIGFGPELVFLVSDVNPSYNFWFGGSGLIEVKTSHKVGVTFSIGYIKYKSKVKDGYKQPDIDQLSPLIGARYYFTNYFFASGQFGYSFHQDEFREIGASAVIAPAIGAKYGILDATLKYTYTRRINDFSNIGLRLAVAF